MRIKNIVVEEATLPETLKKPMGAFVTLKDRWFSERLYRKIYFV